MKQAFFAAVLAAFGLAAAASAQETGAAAPPSQQPNTTPPAQRAAQGPTPATFQNEVRIQGVIFGNFFQAANGAPSEDVDGISAAYRGIYRPGGWKTDLYGEINAMKYTNIQREKPYGLRAGVRHDDAKQSFDVFVDRGLHRAAFDVGDRTAIATITTLSGDYAYNVTKEWQLGAEALQERQRFDVETNQKNNYTRGGLSIRFRGWGYKFSPRVGYVVGHRDVASGVDSYHERYPYLQVISMPIPAVYLSVSYRPRKRTYDEVTNPLLHSVDRPQWSGFGSYRFTKSLTGTVYYSREKSKSPVAYRNFETSFLMVGATVHF